MGEAKRRREIRQTLTDGRVVDVVHSPFPEEAVAFMEWTLHSQHPDAVAIRKWLETRDLSNYSPPDTLVVRPMEDKDKEINPADLAHLPRVRQ